MSAQQPGHPPREGDPDLLAQPVETRVPADGRHAVAHLPMVTPTTDTTPWGRADRGPPRALVSPPKRSLRTLLRTSAGELLGLACRCLGPRPGPRCRALRLSMAGERVGVRRVRRLQPLRRGPCVFLGRRQGSGRADRQRLRCGLLGLQAFRCGQRLGRLRPGRLRTLAACLLSPWARRRRRLSGFCGGPGGPGLCAAGWGGAGQRFEAGEPSDRLRGLDQTAGLPLCGTPASASTACRISSTSCSTGSLTA